MFGVDDDISMDSAPSAPSSAAQNAAMALAILGPNHRGNVTFEAIDAGNSEQGQEGQITAEEELLNSTANSSVMFAERSAEPEVSMQSSFR